MKKYIGPLAVILAATLAVAGCGKKNRVDAAAFQNNFNSASLEARTMVSNALAAIKSGDYRTAKNELHVLRDDTSLTPEQQAAIWDLMGKIQ